MDVPFYHDEALPPLAPPSPGAMLKKEALGELPKAPDGPTAAALLAAAAAASPPPELGLLKLASPELERLLIQSQHGLVTTTPTSACPFAKGADEQEFAAGFVKALEDLHQQHQQRQQRHAQHPQLRQGLGAPEPPPEPPVYAPLSSYAPDVGGPFAAPPPLPKDEAQTVPEAGCGGGGGGGGPGDCSPPLSPIDMDTQERIKAERKRLRNRIAASKCRRRKLERISRLEEKVKSLKSQNTELASTASLLREQVAQLKQKVLSHVNSGCQLLPRAAPPQQQPHQVPAY